MSALADRIRGIVAPSSVAQGSPVAQGFSPATNAVLKACTTGEAGDIAEILGGAWVEGCFVVDRRWAPSAAYGRERVGALAERLEQAAGEAALFASGAPAKAPFVFFDLETTGLSGGAGTLAFLVGCARFEADGSFATRQFLLTRHADERMLLEAVAPELARAGALVSFNGKSFDAPLLEGRYLFHRLTWCGREMPHMDVLHAARRFWKPRDGGGAARWSPLDEARGRPFGGRGAAGASQGGGCSLQSLERTIVGARREGDVPGFEIPGRYFQFVRSGDARPLEAVLEHNRFDLLTLAALTARLLQMTRNGPDAVSDPREALALGHVYARAHRHAEDALGESTGGGLDGRARASYQRAIERCRSPRGAYDPIRIDALRALALAYRRDRRHEDAASCWRELADMRGCPDAIAREAAEALAIHHEHRLRDLTAAKAYALRNLGTGTSLGWANAARYRLARLERKLVTDSLKFEV